MKKLSLETKQTLAKLDSQQAALESPTSSTLTELITLLHSLEEENNVVVIPYVLPFALSTNSQLSIAAKQTIHQIYSNAALESLIGLDQYIREVRYYYSPLRKIDFSYLDSLPITHAHDLTWLGILSFHRNGFIRERAIQKLGKSNSDQAIPFLLIRLNDWVDRVRSIALHVIKSMLNSTHISGFIASIYLVNHLIQYRRTDCNWLYHEIFHFLTQTEEHILTESLYSKDKSVRRFSLDLCLQSTRLNKEILLQSLLSHKDPIMRLKASKYIRNTLDNQVQIKWLPLLLRDPFMPVRREGFTIWYDQSSTITEEDLKVGLLDPHPSIRELSRFYAKKYTQMDLPTLYRTELANTDSPYLATTIIGLGETGEKSDCLLIEPYLQHHNLTIRKNTWKALSYLDFKTYQPSFIEALRDSSLGISKIAKRILEKHNNSLYLKELWQIFEEAVTTNRPVVQKRVISLFATVSRTDRIIYYLKVMRSTTDLLVLHMTKLHLSNLLEGFGIRFYITFQPYEVELIHEELLKRVETLDESIVESIKFLTIIG